MGRSRLTDKEDEHGKGLEAADRSLVGLDAQGAHRDRALAAAARHQCHEQQHAEGQADGLREIVLSVLRFSGPCLPAVPNRLLFKRVFIAGVEWPTVDLWR